MYSLIDQLEPQPGKRIVTTKPGDVLLHNGEPRKVIGVEVYRALPAG